MGLKLFGTKGILWSCMRGNRTRMGFLKIIGYQVAWYDMTRNGRCFDESFYPPEEISKVIHHVETTENETWSIKSRVFMLLDNGNEYELKLEKIEEGRRCEGFYD